MPRLSHDVSRLLRVTVTVPTDLERACLPRWRRALDDLRRAGPRGRLRLMVTYVRKVCYEGALRLAKAVLLNRLALRLWVRLLKGRIEFFGNSHSIGDMAVDVDYYLLWRLAHQPKTIGVHLINKPHLANQYLADFQARALGSQHIIFIRNRFLCQFLESLERQLFFAGPKTPFSYTPADYNEMTRQYNFHLERQIPADDRRLCRALMEKLGLPPEARFVAVHVREAGFKAHFHRSGHNTFRDADINTYVPAIEWLIERGLWVVRMGETSVKPLPQMERVIDYARSALKSDFLDVLLLAECEFLVTCCSGLQMVAHVFNKPFLCANAIPLIGLPYRPSAFWIPKLLWSRRAGRYLTLAEIAQCGAGEYQHTQDYEAAGIEIHANSTEDIREATEELYRWYTGILQVTEEERWSQQAVTKLFPSSYQSYGTQARLCVSFVRRHVDLMPQASAAMLVGVGMTDRS